MSNTEIWEVQIQVGPAAVEAVVHALESLDSMGVSVEDAGSVPVFEAGGTFQQSRIRGYFPEECGIRQVDAMLRELLKNDPDGEKIPVWHRLANQDWQESWKEHFHPLPLGQRLLILPSWLEPPAGMAHRLVVRMDPEMAFGSGQHPTTQGCLEALERWADAGSLGPTLDLGTGSGILAIAALLLGASRVVATDVDGIAVTTARRNGGINLGHLTDWSSRLTILQTDQVPAGGYHTILANILAPVLCELALAVAQALLPGGRAILAGLLGSQVREVIAAYEAVGLVLARQVDLGDWTVLEWNKERGCHDH